jgi:transcriptional regulator with XRE-family HTH domain
MTQAELAKMSGLTPEYISMVENDKKSPGFTTLQKLSKALNVPIFVLVLLSEYESFDGSWKDLLGDVVLKIKKKTKLE